MTVKQFDAIRDLERLQASLRDVLRWATRAAAEAEERRDKTKMLLQREYLDGRAKSLRGVEAKLQRLLGVEVEA